MNQIFHPYELWEDKKNGMYEHVKIMGTESWQNNCIKLLTDEKLFYKTMQNISREWIYSSQVNLSNPNNNRRAWLGRAACCYYYKAPENITQAAWISMTSEQRESANKTADRFIRKWERDQSEQIDLFGDCNA